MKKYFSIIIFTVIIIFTFSCDEGNDVIFVPNATLIWTGSYDLDGCGFFIEIDSIEYKAENEGIIPPAFKVDHPLSVTIQYIDLLYDLEYNCGDSLNTSKAKAIKLTYMDLNGDLN